MPTAVASLPAIDHAFAAGVFLGATRYPARVINTDIDVDTEPDYITDPILCAWSDTQVNNTLVSSAYFKFKTLVFEEGWSKYSAFKVWVMLPPDMTHGEVDAYIEANFPGQTIDTLYATYAGFFGMPPEVAIGQSAVVYDLPGVLQVFSGGIDAQISPNITYQFTLSALDNPGALDSLYGAGYPGGGIAGITNLNFSAAGVNNVSMTGNGNYTWNAGAGDTLDLGMFLLCYINRASASVVVSDISGYMGVAATNTSWDYTLYPSDSAPPVNEPVLAIAGNRYGLTNRNHGFAVNPRKSRG